ncbi:DoxX family protein [Hyphobacterium indicum]|uniref:DoxX family protein n=1 Tax=Hyphobacterium indicum TaxID=2162714 RepID=UPI000D6525EB|nr:DoxX family protein [Hyphobacterium indicum]
MLNFLYLPFLARFKELAVFFLRVLTGVFLIHGVWDNVVSRERMAEFEAFMSQFGFPMVEIMAPLSVYTQLIGGLGLVFGLFTRWAGILVTTNFIVAMVMVHLNDDLRTMWPAIVLVAIGGYFATAGGGRLSIDRMLTLRGS